MALSIGDVHEFLAGFCTQNQAAKEIGVTTMTLWRWEREGKLRAYRIGREVLLEKAEVERLRRERQ